jgi:hypothetical protein
LSVRYSVAVTSLRIVLVALGYLVTHIVVVGCIGVEGSSTLCANVVS